jgi:hypothetical protein
MPIFSLESIQLGHFSFFFPPPLKTKNNSLSFRMLFSILLPLFAAVSSVSLQSNFFKKFTTDQTITTKEADLLLLNAIEKNPELLNSDVYQSYELANEILDLESMIKTSRPRYIYGFSFRSYFHSFPVPDWATEELDDVIRVALYSKPDCETCEIVKDQSMAQFYKHRQGVETQEDALCFPEAYRAFSDNPRLMPLTSVYRKAAAMKADGILISEHENMSNEAAEGSMLDSALVMHNAIGMLHTLVRDLTRSSDLEFARDVTALEKSNPAISKLSRDDTDLVTITFNAPAKNLVLYSFNN